MTRFAGLDVSASETSVCVVDDAGKVLAERKVTSEPDDIVALLRSVGGEWSASRRGTDLRGTLRNFGLQVGVVSTSGFEARIRELVEDFPRLAAIVEPVLAVRQTLRQQFAVLHKMLLGLVRQDPVCRPHDGARRRPGRWRGRPKDSSTPPLIPS